jgi:site-specific DNA recombinase
MASVVCADSRPVSEAVHQSRKGVGGSRTAVYLRVSTEEQRERHSIETQRDFAERFCALHEIPVYGYYTDDGVSGTVALEQRPEGARLLSDAREGRFSAVLLYKLDRLGRNPRLILNAVADLELEGVQTRSMTEPFDTSSPTGRFLLTMLSGVAGLERDTIIERSVVGTDRLAHDGAWLGGIVPYGYRVVGKARESRLIVSDEPIHGLTMSEADVIRLIYRLTVEEDRSCPSIADYLNRLGVPSAYARDGRGVTRGKRKQATAGIWRPSRVRNLIASTVYKGTHQYGKRSKRERDIIERPVPAVVGPDTWEQAQQILRRHMLFSRRNAKRQYLLRGLMKCGLCGLTYIGVGYPADKTGAKAYYVCNGKHGSRGLYGLLGRKCPSKAISAEIEHTVWQDIEAFLRNPGEVLAQLSQRLDDRSEQAEQHQHDADSLQAALQGKRAERDVILGLYRRGRIDGSTLERQLDQIEREEAELADEVSKVEHLLQNIEAASAQLQTADDWLRKLNQRLDHSLTWELKRQLVEALVESVQVETIERDSKKYASVAVTYCFASTATCTGRDSSRRSA